MKIVDDKTVQLAFFAEICSASLILDGADVFR
jgi:hypothetical protein